MQRKKPPIPPVWLIYFTTTIENHRENHIQLEGSIHLMADDPRKEPLKGVVEMFQKKKHAFFGGDGKNHHMDTV